MKNILKVILGASIVLSSVSVSFAHTINVVQGASCAEHMQRLINLRLETFREFPYLYVGTKEIEEFYVGDYPKDPHTLFGMAYVNQEFAGILTGIPLQAICTKDPVAQAACQQAGLIIAQHYYLGEVITLKQFRNQGIATSNFKALEENVKKLGYKYTCFITVEREENDPRKPADYKSPASLFTKLGYTKTSLRIPHVWPTVQPDGTIVQDFENIVAVWTKEL